MKALESERGLFLKSFMLNPMKIGSITPSSSYLTRDLLASLPWDTMHTIVELGAGTGVFTKYIIKHKQQDSAFLIIEQDTQMRSALMRQFPNELFGSQAENLPYLMQQYNLPKADCIISGLPFAIFEKKDRLKILTGIQTTLSNDGVFAAFQYSPQMYRTFQHLFHVVRIGFTPLNLPPAFTYLCYK